MLTVSEASQHPHNVARHAFITVNGVLQNAPAPRFSATVPDEPRPPVTAGADTRAVLRQAGFATAKSTACSPPAPWCSADGRRRRASPPATGSCCRRPCTRRPAPRAWLLINSAMGVRRRFYRHLAGHLAEQGIGVLTYDYRGMGDSVLDR